MKISRAPTPMIDAVMHGQKESVRNLISQGHNVNETNELGISPALAAAKRNDLEMLKILVKAGANLEVQDLAGETPLLWANHYRNQDMVDFITNNMQQITMPSNIGSP